MRTPVLRIHFYIILLEWIALAEEQSAPRRLTLTLKHHPMERGDALPLLLLTAVYALTAFFQLGDFNAPQSMVRTAPPPGRSTPGCGAGGAGTTSNRRKRPAPLCARA